MNEGCNGLFKITLLPPSGGFLLRFYRLSSQVSTSSLSKDSFSKRKDLEWYGFRLKEGRINSFGYIRDESNSTKLNSKTVNIELTDDYVNHLRPSVWLVHLKVHLKSKMYHPVTFGDFKTVST